MVVIGSPSDGHADEAIAAARTGLHVLTEKPIDITTERADTMFKVAKRTVVRLVEQGHIRRFSQPSQPGLGTRLLRADRAEPRRKFSAVNDIRGHQTIIEDFVKCIGRERPPGAMEWKAAGVSGSGSDYCAAGRYTNA